MKTPSGNTCHSDISNLPKRPEAVHTPHPYDWTEIGTTVCAFWEGTARLKSSKSKIPV